MTEQRNWAGNYTYRAARWHHPGSLEEVRAIVRGARRVKVVGSRHSFNGVADTTGDLLSLERLNRITLDEARRTVTVEGGVRYGELSAALHARGFALHNLASLPHLSVAGAVATATHGSGDALGNLSTAVSVLEFVTADGEVVTATRERAPDFHGMVVSLGALGVVTRLTLDVQPTYLVRQDVYEHLPLAALEAHFDAIMAGADSVSLFTHWREASFHQVWLKRRVDAGNVPDLPREWFGAVRATRDLHPITRMPAVNSTPQLGVAGPWHERLPHFRLAFTPSSGEELQSEYLVPREHALAAIRAVQALGAHIGPLLQVSEVRTVAADPLWMSPCFERASAALHFTWVPDEAAVRAALPRLEAALAPLGARPHWGKVFTTPPDHLRALYPRLADFRALLARHDPGGKFRNAFLDAGVFGDAAD